MSRLRSDLLAGHASSENQSGVVPAQPLIINIRVIGARSPGAIRAREENQFPACPFPSGRPLVPLFRASPTDGFLPKVTSRFSSTEEIVTDAVGCLVRAVSTIALATGPEISSATTTSSLMVADSSSGVSLLLQRILEGVVSFIPLRRRKEHSTGESVAARMIATSAHTHRCATWAKRFPHPSS